MVSNSLRSINCSRCGNSSVRTPCGLSRVLEPFHKIVQIGNLRQNVVADDQIREVALLASSGPSFVPKKRARVGTPFSTATLATFAAGSMPSTGT